MSRTNKVVQSAAMISIFTLISKFMGFIREMLIASKYGAGYETDTYFVAMTATTIIMSTIGSAINTSLIPVFTEIGEKNGRKGRNTFLNNILNVILLLTLILVIVGFFASPLLIKILANGFEGEQFDLAVKLNRIGLPIVICLGLTYVFSGYLQSAQIFGPPAMMGIPYNLVFIIFLFFMADKFTITGLMFVSVLAATTQFLIQAPAVRHQGYRYSLNVNLNDPYIKKTLSLVGPVILGSSIQQINTIIDKTLASNLVEGSISALNYSAKINDVVVAVFITAITTVVFPMLSKAFAQGDINQAKKLTGEGINIILIITVPATIGIMILAEPLVRIFFERNAFDSTATSMTSSALFFYSLGLVGISLRLMLNKVFYSLQDTKTPMINGALSVGLNVILNLILIKPMAHAGLALATSISTTFTSILLFLSLRKKIGPMGLKSYLICFIKSLAVSLIMGVVVYLIYFGLGNYVGDSQILDLLLLILAVVVGMIVYFILCIVFRIKEMRVLVNRLIKRG